MCQTSSGKVPGRMVSTSSPQVIGCAAEAQHPDMPVTPGVTEMLKLALQALENMHEGAIEHRIALANQRDSRPAASFIAISAEASS